MRDNVWEIIMIILSIFVVIIILLGLFPYSRVRTIDCEKVMRMAEQDKSYMPAYENCKERM